MDKNHLLTKLWEQYAEITPSAKKIHDLLEEKGEEIKNDHIAIRTFSDKRVAIEILEKPFLLVGYQAKGKYNFESKKLFAKHYEHSTDKKAPRIFISELELEKCSPRLQETVKNILDGCDQNEFNNPELVLSGSFWKANSLAVYKSLLNESEYAAWMYIYGFRANHFTINVNALKDFDSLQELNVFIENKGWKLNESGGKIKGIPEQLLEQSSTLADLYSVDFKEGTLEIPSCYYEFALRYPMQNGELYQGFIASSADKIFESTDVKLQEVK
ncbi:MAG TPA: DUF1338 domain-containing protein [Flavobacterium sp.]|jgi:hypothetical protein|uniref:DUF1338 domain-containing protein n=1 Tax=Flavobacterium sp. TaxID=239 RepID=UPI001B6A4F23|nr:DUF1338 domain-containing protein [Flavobacterium sp.]MBP7182154.1 DUF1338 domain-containing protein [Flavobacterium sp.]MBP7317652.1 DUF1338 domain-containing protein [Flavobacterium sp.]HRL71528.1 DUF1338 domain-containing protein [Flavobacterium sp.]HRM46329.1 DUF1338 domain-containing protein [Flavobacterium sp.]